MRTTLYVGSYRCISHTHGDWTEVCEPHCSLVHTGVFHIHMVIGLRCANHTVRWFIQVYFTYTWRLDRGVRTTLYVGSYRCITHTYDDWTVSSNA